MTNGQIIGDGTSRKLRAKFPDTYEEFKQKAASAELMLDILMNIPGWSVVPTMLTKENLLQAVTEKRLELPEDSTVDAAFNALIPKVGDLYTTILTDVGDKYLLCNGSQLAGGNPEYEELYKLLPLTEGTISGTISMPDASYYQTEVTIGAGMAGDHYVVVKRTGYASDRHKMFLKIVDKNLNMTTKEVSPSRTDYIMSDTAVVVYFKGNCVIFFCYANTIQYAYSSDFSTWKVKDTGKAGSEARLTATVFGNKLVFATQKNPYTTIDCCWIDNLASPTYHSFSFSIPARGSLFSLTASNDKLFCLSQKDEDSHTWYLSSSSNLSRFDRITLTDSDYPVHFDKMAMKYTNNKLILVVSERGDPNVRDQSGNDSGFLLIAKDPNDLSKGFNTSDAVLNARKTVNMKREAGATLAGNITYVPKEDSYVIPFYACVVACDADFKNAIVLKPIHEYALITDADSLSEYGRFYDSILVMEDAFGVPYVESSDRKSGVDLWEFLKGYTLPTISLQGAHVYIRAKE